METLAPKFIFNLLCFLLILGPSSPQQTNTLVQRQELKDGVELVSADGIFRLGFFNLTPNNYYLGIWYNDDRLSDVVWVANPDAPIFGKSSSLTIDDYGSLKISYGDKGHSISLYSTQGASNTSAVLLDTGNFVLQELNSDGTVKQDLWQSFDYPTDTLLPGMKLGVNKITGHNWTLRSWRSVVVPDFGSFSFGMNEDPKPGNEFVILWHGEAYWIGGFSNEKGYQSWPTNGFSLPDQRGVYYSFVKITNENETYFNYSTRLGATLPRLRINYLGNLHLYERLLVECSTLSPASNEGCVKQTLPECRRHDYTFIENSAYIVDGDVFEFNESDNLTRMDCQNRCLSNCSCVAYASSKQDDIGCKIWTRVPSIEMSQNAPTIYFLEYKAKPNRWWIWLIVAGGGIIIILLCSLYYAKQKKHKAEGERERKEKMLIQELAGNAIPSTVDDEGKKQNNDGKNSHELHVFSFESIFVATSNFSTENKLGEGGFGPVYKGKLPNGQEIAIKRLSKSSGQGLVEFKNEAILIAKLQHTNLVRLLGFCIQGEEKMLIYEYMPNKSLDMPNKSLDIFLFDPTKKHLLNWKTRFNIIEGIAQGLVYLHKYSRLRVIHRDLKASNILLDEEMNPKIFDFGMARIFGSKGSEENTNRVVGTYGYMSPEYAMNGVVSIKTDVFSFRVLLLEIVSGKKNNNRHYSDSPLNLVVYAWQLWNEGKDFELIDPTTEDESYCPCEVSRCIHVGLLCVQDQAADRPTMLDVVSMLSNETLQLSPPKQPAFFINTFGEEREISKNKQENCSINNVTISMMEAR